MASNHKSTPVKVVNLPFNRQQRRFTIEGELIKSEVFFENLSFQSLHSIYYPEKLINPRLEKIKFISGTFKHDVLETIDLSSQEGNGCIPFSPELKINDTDQFRFTFSVDRTQLGSGMTFSDLHELFPLVLEVSYFRGGKHPV